MNGPLLFGVLIFLATFIVFLGLWRTVGTRSEVDERLAAYGAELAVASGDDEGLSVGRRRYTGLTRWLNGLGLGPQLADNLAMADLPLTAAEFALLMIGLGGIGFLIGAWRLGPLLGLVMAAVFAYLPVLYLKRLRTRRQRQFASQLPDVLTMLVGALRAGYGITQAIQVLVDQLPPPASKEFARVLRAVNVGLPVHRALTEMAARVNSDDVDLVVTAINVQHEIGGNLAETLDIIGQTVRDRIRIKREVGVQTAQQRLTGLVLALLPIGLGVILFFINPQHMMGLFEPGWPRLMPVAALVMQFMGYMVIRRILDIEV